MEIIFKSNENQSNFNYSSNLFKGKKTLNSFNKLTETMLSDKFYCQNVNFDNEIVGDLILCYPFNTVVKEEIKFKSLYDLITAIRKAYYKIYTKEAETIERIKKYESIDLSNELYGIWGHSIYDLCISSIKIVENGEKPLIDVSISS